MDTDVAIVGAGPYGLSVAAHLAERGVDTCVFGPPMESWRKHMPAGMLLKSDPFASSLCAPVAGWTLREYCVRNGIPYGDTEPRSDLARFVEYGDAFQQRFVPDLDTRLIIGVAPALGGFSLTLEDGEVVTARRVVMAVGITHFATMPSEFTGLGEAVTHSSDHRTFDEFNNRRVAVIGAGSSATEITANLVNAGAHVQLVTRREKVLFWGAPDPDAPPPTRLQRLCNPSTGLGPGMRNKLCQDLPDAFRYLSADRRLTVIQRHLGPISPWWVREAVEQESEVLTRTTVRHVRVEDDGVVVTTSSDATGATNDLNVDHVICATGYTADIDRLTFLDADIRSSLKRIGSMPELNRGFESSVPGLYFVGAAAAGTFGPLLRFVVGTEFAAPRVAARLRGRTPGQRVRFARRQQVAA